MVLYRIEDWFLQAQIKYEKFYYDPAKTLPILP